jgi:hypothetical protein
MVLWSTHSPVTQEAGVQIPKVNPFWIGLMVGLMGSLIIHNKVVTFLFIGGPIFKALGLDYLHL